MKQNIFLLIFIVVTTIVTTSYSQTQRDVNYTRMLRLDDSITAITTIGTEKIYVLRAASNYIDIYTFSNQDIENLVRGNAVLKENEHYIGIITSLFPFVATQNKTDIKKYIWTNGYIRLAEPTKFTFVKPSFSLVATILLYLPLLFIFVVFVSSWDTNKGKEQVIIFTTASSLAIVIGAIGGAWLGPMGGLSVGVIAGFCAMFMTSLATDYFKRAISAVLVAITSAGMVGAYVGELYRCGFRFYDSEAFMLWLYLGYYIATCLAAIGIRALVVAKENRRSSNQFRSSIL